MNTQTLNEYLLETHEGSKPLSSAVVYSPEGDYEQASILMPGGDDVLHAKKVDGTNYYQFQKYDEYLGQVTAIMGVK